MPEFICRVNEEDQIVFVDESWMRFASENGLAFLTVEKILGVPLLDFISDVTTRHLYRVLMHTVRRTGQEISFPFRCDAPDRRRFMRMTIRSLPTKEIEFRSEIVREEIRAKVNLFDPSIPRRSDFVVMCSWCKKIKAPDWVEVEEGVARLKLFDSDRLPRVSHGICPTCERGMELQISRLNA